MNSYHRNRFIVLGAVFPLMCLGASAHADQVFLDDVIVDGSLCVGFDCVNGESFGFDTIRLKENNLRIRFDDTSNSSSFPKNDWQITINDTTNGGVSKFSIDDITSGRTPFTIRAGAPSNSLYVDSSGRLGLGTATPVTTAHLRNGNTPTLRLEQDGSSGFSAQSWDLAGNEANFFIRDVTNGSKLPFRIRPGAPTSSIDIAADGDVGIGTASPSGALHVSRTGNVITYIESSNDMAVQLRLISDSDNRRILARNGADSASESQILLGNGEIQLAGATTPGDLYATFNASGLTLQGASITVNGTTLDVPDYVFEKDHPLMPLTELKSFIEENRHLPGIPSATDIDSNGINLTEMQLGLLKKIEELTLYTLRQQETIDNLNTKLSALETGSK